MNEQTKAPPLTVVDDLVRGPIRARRKQKVRGMRYRMPVAEETRRFDPLAREGRRSRAVNALLYGIGAVLLHGAVMLGLIGFGRGPRDLGRAITPEKVTVRIPDPPPMPKPEPKPVAPPPVVTEKPIAPPPVAPRRPKKTAEPAPVATNTPPTPSAEIPTDPVNVPSEPTAASPRRRVVGLSFESTVTGGKGPSFAVGNTRMGQTGVVAEDGKTVPKAAGQSYTPRPVGTTNKVAAAIPTAGVTLTKPKRLATITPEYPKLLKTQGIEGNVVVLIRIDKTGAVKSAKVIKGSGFDAFDAAARQAALKERYTPANRNGEPIDYTLKFTYRFRVKDE